MKTMLDCNGKKLENVFATHVHIHIWPRCCSQTPLFDYPLICSNMQGHSTQWDQKNYIYVLSCIQKYIFKSSLLKIWKKKLWNCEDRYFVITIQLHIAIPPNCSTVDTWIKHQWYKAMWFNDHRFFFKRQKQKWKLYITHVGFLYQFLFPVFCKY